MNIRNPGRWLLVALAVLAIALAAPAVTAHDDPSQATETATQDAQSDGTDVGPIGWMADRMADHVGPETAEAMGFHRQGPAAAPAGGSHYHSNTTTQYSAEQYADHDEHPHEHAHNNSDVTTHHGHVHSVEDSPGEGHVPGDEHVEDESHVHNGGQAHQGEEVHGDEHVENAGHANQGEHVEDAAHTHHGEHVHEDGQVHEDEHDQDDGQAHDDSHAHAEDEDPDDHDRGTGGMRSGGHGCH